MFSLYEYPEPLKYIPTDTSYLDRFKEYIKFSLFLAQNQLKLIARKVFNVSFDHSLTYGIANILTNMSKSKSKSKNAYKSEKLFKHL
jgi:hypothetical protein